MEFALPPDFDALSREATRVGRAGAQRRRISEDGWLMGYDAPFALELATRGWIGMTWPVEVGGAGRSPLERLIVFEALISEGAPLAAMYFADRQVGPTLLQFGTPGQHRRWLPGILAGTSMWCIGLSEPDAGSDVASIRTRATVDPNLSDTWRISGSKIWNSGAAHANWCYLVARTDPDARPHAGLSEFVVDMTTPGIDVRPIVDQTGDNHFCEVHFDNVAVPSDCLIGTPNGSFGQVMRQMEYERGGIDRLTSNRRLYLDCLAFANMENPLVRQQIARLESDYRIGRLLVLREVLGQAPRAFSAATKTFCTEHEQRVAAFCGAVFGVNAQAWTTDTHTEGRASLAERVARALVYAPAYTLMGGTTQILRTIIADRVLGLPRV